MDIKEIVHGSVPRRASCLAKAIEDSTNGNGDYCTCSRPSLLFTSQSLFGDTFIVVCFFFFLSIISNEKGKALKKSFDVWLDG